MIPVSGNVSEPLLQPRRWTAIALLLLLLLLLPPLLLLPWTRHYLATNMRMQANPTIAVLAQIHAEQAPF
jgi:hypothetical protein